MCFFCFYFKMSEQRWKENRKPLSCQSTGTVLTTLYFIEFTRVTQHGDRGWNRPKVPTDIHPFVTHPAHERLYHTTRVYTPYSLQTVVWVLQRPTRIRTLKELRDRTYSFSSLSEETRNIISQTISGCHIKGSTFSSVILRPSVFVWPGFEPATSCSADQHLSNWANQAAVVFGKKWNTYRGWSGAAN